MNRIKLNKSVDKAQKCLLTNPYNMIELSDIINATLT